MVGGVIGYAFAYNAFPDDRIVMPIYSISAQEIFSNDIPIFDVDFFNSDGDKEFITFLGEKVTIESTANKLKGIIARWYANLRDIATVVLLSVLVYIGIRILLSSTSNDKAKYKQMIVDWVVALCLLFTMHYIMAFSNIIVKNVTDVVKSSTEEGQYLPVIKYDDKILDELKEITGDDSLTKDSLGVQKNGDEEYFMWPTNLMGNLRFGVQQSKSGNASYMGQAVCFSVLVLFTVFFIVTYLKRFIYMAFLTLIAPLVAMTYPIDKINDGKAQAFDMWLKEYIFNLLIQPLHLLLYTVLVTSAFDLAAQNVIYSLVALGFMIPAEKLMRKFFGFEKAQTPGLLAGPAGAAMMMTGINKLLSKGPKGGKDSSGKNGGSKSESEKDDSKIRTKDDFDTGAAFDNGLENDKDKESEIALKDLDNDQLSLPQDYQDGNDQLREGYKYSEEITDGESDDTESGQQYIEGNIPSGEEYTYLDDEENRQEDGNDEQNKAGTAEQNTQDAKSKSGKGLKKALGRTARYFAHGVANNMVNKARNAQLGRKAIRMAGGAAVGVAAGTVGLATGIVSGDASKAFQYSAAGVAGGYKLGSGTTGRVISGATGVIRTFKVDGTIDTFKKDYYGKEEYKERQIQKNIREQQRNFELRMALEEKLGSKEAAKKCIEEDLPEYTRYGIDDKNTIVAMAKMQKENNIDRRKAISAALISDKYIKGKDSNSLSKKQSDEFEKTINRDGEKRNLKGAQLEKFSKDIIGTVNKLDSIRYK